MEIVPATVPGSGTLHQVRTRRGHRLGVLVHPYGDRTLYFYVSPSDADDPDSPEHSIVLDRDEADQLAQLLHDRPVTDRIAALERRLAELTAQER